MSLEPQAVTGTFEIHVFVLPLDPPEDVAARFSSVCRGSGETPRMKGLLLQLDYVGKGFVGVLQTSRYVRGTIEDAQRGADEDAALLRDAGFEVVRRKVEAVATNDGVPRTEDDAKRAPGRYFEFHMLIDSPSGPISNEQVASLRTIAGAMQEQLGRPVPLSYNALKPGQRFLNLRWAGGLDGAMKFVDELHEAVTATGVLRPTKVISEYICFDDNRAIDSGWLDP